MQQQRDEEGGTLPSVTKPKLSRAAAEAAEEGEGGDEVDLPVTARKQSQSQTQQPAAKKAKPGSASEKSMVQLGERIYRGGIADRQIPACAGCHSPNGAGIPAQYPRLSGQHAEYAAAQLTAFRDGARQNSLQMSQVAAKLNDREIKAVADYVAGLR